MEKIIFDFKSVWKRVPDYDNYEVSNTGKVRRLDSWVDTIDDKKHHVKERILKSKFNKSGYESVTLCKNGISRGFFIHTLVAKAFIPNPNNLPIVNHKDKNPRNNNLNNLEWCDHSYNAKYSIDEINKSHDKERIKVYRINVYNGEVTEYNGIRIAAKENNTNHSNIRYAINNKGLCAGYRWSKIKPTNVKDYSIDSYNKNSNNTITVVKVDKNNFKNYTIFYKLNDLITDLGSTKKIVRNRLNKYKLIKDYYVFTYDKFLIDIKSKL